MKQFIFATVALFLLASCSAEQNTPAPATPVTAVVESAPTNSSANDQPPAFDTSASIRDLMNTMINPHAMELWRAVRYVTNEDGVQEDTQPRTDEDWARLRASAITLLEAGNAMLMPGRAVDNDTNPDTPDYQYLPGEIQALIQTDPEGWRYFIDEMQFATKATLETIEHRDVLGLIDKGAAINNACEGCHGEFWYRQTKQL